ncbi:hypothetical protein HA402_007384 [Bradysia odoriphaga]|nr:hypothetical protein HA402_007384 [Bradysia odoriphaga]
MHSSYWQSVTVLVLLVIISTKFSEVSSDCVDRRGLCIAENRIVRQDRQVLSQKEHRDNASDRTFRDSLRREIAADRVRQTHSGNRDEQSRSTYIQSRSEQLDRLGANSPRNFIKNDISTTSRNILREERVVAEKRVNHRFGEFREAHHQRSEDRRISEDRLDRRVRDDRRIGKDRVERRIGEDRLDRREDRVDSRRSGDRLDRREDRVDSRRSGDRLNRLEDRVDSRRSGDRMNRREDRVDSRRSEYRIDQREYRVDSRKSEDRLDRREDRVDRQRSEDGVDSRSSEDRLDRREDRVDSRRNEDRLYRREVRVDSRRNRDRLDRREDRVDSRRNEDRLDRSENRRRIEDQLERLADREDRMDRRVRESRVDQRVRVNERETLVRLDNRDVLAQRLQHERDNFPGMRSRQVRRTNLNRLEQREMRRLDFVAQSNARDRSESLGRYIKSSNDYNQRLYDQRNVIPERLRDKDQERKDVLKHEQRHEKLSETRHDHKYFNDNSETRRDDSLKRDSVQRNLLYIDSQNIEMKPLASVYPIELTWNVCQALLIGAIVLQLLKYKNDMGELKSFNGCHFPLLSPIKAL